MPRSASCCSRSSASRSAAVSARWRERSGASARWGTVRHLVWHVHWWAGFRTRPSGRAPMPEDVMSAFRRTMAATVLAAIAAAVACATNPATGQRQLSFMSEEKEIALGQESDAQVRLEMGSYDDRALQEYVTSVGMKLAQVSER